MPSLFHPDFIPTRMENKANDEKKLNDYDTHDPMS